ncbi:hypothetical protein BaRGS_00001513 [Batillaria attramentaria]|uniref:Uncharacterized protein n=1 Tax=Batillaria attramentaria TaxID=370345 RepID=A0ABD0M737_9CAEN
MCLLSSITVKYAVVCEQVLDDIKARFLPPDGDFISWLGSEVSQSTPSAVLALPQHMGRHGFAQTRQPSSSHDKATKDSSMRHQGLIAANFNNFITAILNRMSNE